MHEAILTARRLAKTHVSDGVQTHVLGSVDLDLYDGDFTSVMGPSGSGKSTLLYCLSGMDALTSGEVVFEGEDIARLGQGRLSELRAQRFGLSEVASHLPSQASGGQKQRCAVARAVVNEPAIVFADEPTGALNRANSLEVLDLLGELNRDGIGVLMVTHDVRSAVRGNRVLYFEDGGIRGELELAPWDPASSDDESYVREREAMASAWLASLSW